MGNIAIIGAGIIGVTSAWVLRQQGHQVTLFDRNRYPAMETSFANGGQLSASNAEVWTNFGTIAKGMKWLLKKDAPLLMNLSPSWHKYSWLGEFMSNSLKYEQNTVKTAEMAIESRHYMEEFAKSAGIDFDRKDCGILHIYTQQSEFEHAHKVNNMLGKAGLERRRLTPDEVREIEPTIRSELIGGYYTPSDFTGDIHKFTVQLAEKCAEQGVRFIMNADVSELDHDGEKSIVNWTDEAGLSHSENFDSLVVSAGVSSRKFASQLGDRVNIYPVKGYSITLNLEDELSRKAAPHASLLDDGAKIVSARLGDGRFRIAGTAEFNGFNKDIRADRIAPLVKWVERHFPDVSTEYVIPWAGLRPMLPSMMPKIGAGRKKGVFYNTGHGHLGWTLSCLSAHMLGDMVLQKHNQLAS